MPSRNCIGASDSWSGSPGSQGALGNGLVPRISAQSPQGEAGERAATAALQRALSQGRRVLLQGRPSRFGGRSEAGFDVIPVYRDLRQFPKGKSGAVLNVKQAEMTGSGACAASTLGLGRVAPFWASVPKREVGKPSCGAVLQPHRSYMGASDSEAGPGSREEGEAPPKDVGGV